MIYKWNPKSNTSWDKVDINEFMIFDNKTNSLVSNDSCRLEFKTLKDVLNFCKDFMTRAENTIS
jgi:hypothetical protein